MKLIELLARELKEWPEGGEHVVQDDDCDVKFGAGDDPTFDGTMWMRSTEIYRGQWIDVELADDYDTAIVTREQWENATNQPFEPIPGTTSTPTLETMLTEWRDFEARAQAAQAEADALFEHAGQCHGEIVVRLAELGWGAPRGKPVVTLDDNDGWIEWGGGAIPNTNGVKVDIRIRDGREFIEVTRPSAWRWSTDGEYNDVVAYRLSPSTQP